MVLKSCTKFLVHCRHASIHVRSKILKYVEMRIPADSGSSRRAVLRVAHDIVVSTNSWLKRLHAGVADTYRQLQLTTCSVRHVKICPYCKLTSGCVIHFRANKKFDPFVQTVMSAV